MNSFSCSSFLMFHFVLWQTPAVKFLQNPPAFLQDKARGANWIALIIGAILLVLLIWFLKKLPKILGKNRRIEPAFPGDEESFRAIFDKATAGVGLLDRNERLLHSNRSLQEMLGYSASELLALPLSNFAHPEDAHDAKNPFRDLSDGERAKYSAERRFYHKDGRLLWLRQEIVARNFATSQQRAHTPGAVAAILFEDVTRRHNAEEELRIMREAVHNLYEVIVDRDLDLLDKMGSLLAMGCRRFGTETGVLGQVIDNGFEILQVVSPDERLRKGKVYERSTQISDAHSSVSARHHRLLGNGDHINGQNLSAEATHDWRNFPFYSTSDVEVFLSAPVNVLGRTFGVLCFSSISSREADFSAADREFLQLMAQWLGGELERLQAVAELETKQQALMQVNAQLEALATIDGLTGAKNRRAFNDQLEMEFRRALRYSTPLSLLLLDVDKFKQFNDTLGHQAGDEVLKTVAKVLMKSVRVIDFVARYGGEEFVILLPNTDAEGAIILSERLRIKIEEAPWPARAVTASFGISTLTPEFKEGPELTHAADLALYASKENGRNRSTHVKDIPNPQKNA